MTNRTLIQGTIEYLDVTVTADITLDGDVEVSLDRGLTWTAAAWIGDADTTRTARLLLETAAMDKDQYSVWVKLTDLPEIPIISAGSLLVS